MLWKGKNIHETAFLFVWHHSFPSYLPAFHDLLLCVRQKLYCSTPYMFIASDINHHQWRKTVNGTKNKSHNGSQCSSQRKEGSCFVKRAKLHERDSNNLPNSEIWFIVFPIRLEIYFGNLEILSHRTKGNWYWFNKESDCVWGNLKQSRKKTLEFLLGANTQQSNVKK